MKKRIVRRLGVVALALTLVSMTMMSGTLARYVTEVTGTAKAEVAAWSFKANNADTKFTDIDLGDTQNRTTYAEKYIKNGVIAPGTNGSFDIELDGSASEVGIDYIVNIATETGTTLPDDLTFKVSKDGATAEAYTIGTDITGTIDYDSTVVNMKKTLTVSWEWDFGSADTKSSNDNTYADKSWKLGITATGKQIQPVATSTP